MIEAEGESSGEEGESQASQKARGCCGQFVWPCPRRYPSDPEERRRQRWLIPSDLSSKEFGLIFSGVCDKFGHGPNVSKLHVFDEPHKRYNPHTGVRARHKHLVFKMKTPFAHVRMQQELAAQGIYGHFSFNLVGYVAYLSYCLQPSAKKRAADLDHNPWSWPQVPATSLLALCSQASPQMEARNGLPEGRGRKRKLLTFSELSDAFVESSVKTEQDAWILAKSRKLAGDDTLWNTLGAARCTSTLVAKVRQAWGCESLSGGTLQKTTDYAIKDFVPLGSISIKLVNWLRKDWKTKTLILSGAPQLGKTELGCTLVSAVSPAKVYHFINKEDRLRDVTFSPGEGLIVDEACFVTRDVDDVKALVDLAKTRDVTCRNKDGRIPRGTPRVFSTNWPWEQFWPREAFGDTHAGAIQRRVVWVNVESDVRKIVAPAAVVASPVLPVDDESLEDPFGFGFSMD